MNNISPNIKNIINTVESSSNTNNILTITEFKDIQSKLSNVVNNIINNCDLSCISSQCSTVHISKKKVKIGSFDLDDVNFPGCDLEKVRSFIFKNHNYKVSKKYIITFQLSQRIVGNTAPMTYQLFYDVLLALSS